MPSTENLIKILEEFAPLELACDWDNSGWQVNLKKEGVNKLLLALSPTLDVIEQAIEKNCDMIITHHPLIFDKLSNIDTKNTVHNSIAKAIKHNIQIYSAHTNLDLAKGGLNDVLAGLLGLNDIFAVEEFVKIGILEERTDLSSFSETIKNALSADKFKLINPNEISKVQKIAVCTGSGGDFISKLSDIDLYITGDVKYHSAIEVKDFAVIDAGHFETERIILPVLKELVEKNGYESIIAEEKQPWEIV